MSAVTYNPSGTHRWIDVESAYSGLFDTIKPLLSKYDMTIEVGRHEFVRSHKEVVGTIMLTKEEIIEFIKDKNGVEDINPTWIGEAFHYLYEPEKILENLINSLILRVEKNNERVRELDQALRFVQGLWLADYHKEEQVR